MNRNRFQACLSIAAILLGFASQAAGAPVLRPKITGFFPHDASAFCQGLIYLNGYLYESTGLHGQSSIRKVELETGKVVKQERLSSMLFGEGLAAYNQVLYQLTWKSRLGLIWFRESFRLLRNFQYNTEGWGLTYDGKDMILSDGSDHLYFHDPATFAVRRTIAVRDKNRPVTMLNELEWIEGLVFANVWTTDSIIVIEPRSGTVKAWIDCSGFLSPSERKGADALNGIAFDPGKRRLFLTGKNWPRLFEIDYPALKKQIAGHGKGK